jgi:hypothetical protein
MASTLFWVLVVVAAVVAVYLMCGGKKLNDVMTAFNSSATTTTVPATAPTASTAPKALVPDMAPVTATVRLPFNRRQATLTVEHNEPLLGSLFSRELESLPDGISREEFERQVSEYQQQHLKEAELKIPRSMNFNYEKYAAEQESMRRNVGAAASRFIQREQVGGITEQLAKSGPTQVQMVPRSFLKKVVAKRR